MSLAVATVPVPVPPVGALIDPALDHVVTTVMAVLVGVALLFSLFYWRRTGRPTFLVLFAAGGAMMLLEPFVDTVGGCWHPANAIRAFTLWGRPMPLWLCLCYFVFFGIGGGLTWLALRTRPTGRTVWGLFVFSALGDVVLEVTLLHFHTYVYYGDQPLVLLSFPLWWAPVNSLIDVAVAVLIVRYESALVGVRQLLIVPLAMATSAAMNTIAGWPSWTAVNSDLGAVGRELAGLATFAVAIVLVRAMANAMTGGGTPSSVPGADRVGPVAVAR
jgi:hypothetical protein